MRSLRNPLESLSCKLWFLEHTKIRLNPKDEPFISKIEQVTWIFVRLPETKSQFYQIFKSQNLNQFLRFGPNFLHVSSISLEVHPLPDPGFEGVKSIYLVIHTKKSHLWLSIPSGVSGQKTELLLWKIPPHTDEPFYLISSLLD